MRMLSVVLLSCAITASFVTPNASAGPVLGCGSTITENTKLKESLDCPGDGLTVGASDIVLDLNGRTITRTGVEGGVGITIDTGVNGVTVRNGTISNFGVGVYVDGMITGTLAGLKILDGPIGIQLDGTNGVTVKKNLLDRNAGSGIALIGAQNSSVTKNKITFSADGILVSDGATQNTISKNRVTDAFSGVTLNAAPNNTVSKNKITGGTYGVYAIASIKARSTAIRSWAPPPPASVCRTRARTRSRRMR